MAEGIMKKFYGTGTYVQSVGVINDLEIDGFAIATCEEIGVELSRHRSRSFDEMEQWGDDLSSFRFDSGTLPCKPETRPRVDAVFSI
jgi:hypothetical protein